MRSEDLLGGEMPGRRLLETAQPFLFLVHIVAGHRHGVAALHRLDLEVDHARAAKALLGADDVDGVEAREGRIQQHDRAVATISHLPYLLAASLIHVEIDANSQDEVTGALAASGFRDTTRLAASSIDMMLDILLTNSEPLVSALDQFEAKIAEVRGMLGDPIRLRDWVAEARCKRMEMFR